MLGSLWLSPDRPLPADEEAWGAWSPAGLALPDCGLLIIRDGIRLAVGGAGGETRKDAPLSVRIPD